MDLVVKRLICRILSLFLALNSICANCQEIYYADGNGTLSEVTDGIIDTDSKFVTLSWIPFRLNEPYTIEISKDDVVISSETTRIPSYVINSEEADGAVIHLTNERGDEAKISITYHKSYANVIIGIAIAAFLIGVLYSTLRYRKKVRHAVEERIRAEEGVTAPRKSKKYDCATVLFSDIQGFTKIAEHMNPEQLVDQLDRYFIYFDELVEKYNVEKIKTIGDAYMCAGGVPNMDSANPIEVALVGLGMIEYVRDRRETTDGFWNIRVGIHTGPVVSAAIGNKKKIFDIWGDSVNTASRMESSGVPGEVNVSGDTYSKISNYFECEYRGKMPVKYKGEIDMYFVKRLKAEYAEPGSIYKPNQLMKTKMQTMKVNDILAEFVERFREDDFLLYVERFENMLIDCEIICRHEYFSETDTMLAKILSMLAFAHRDCPKMYKVDMVELSRHLRRIHVDDSFVDNLNKMVNRVLQKKQPESHIEEVVNDTYNIMYYKRDFAIQIKNQYTCSMESGKFSNKKEWYKSQVHAIENIVLYTNSAREMAEVEPKKQIEILDQIFQLI